jgi:hypothetical protein
MEIGDLFYIIILSVFMILGFFNDSKKKKNEQKQQNVGPKPKSFHSEEDEVLPPLFKKVTPPKPVVVNRKRSFEGQPKYDYSKEGEAIFRSSKNYSTDFSKESSLGSSIYINDTGETYEQLSDDQNRTESFDNNLALDNNVINDLIGDNRRNELVKGLIYTEILKRKY